MNDHGYLDTCRDDLPVMDCVDLVARDACGAMTDIEQESCRVTCKTCQTSNCIDTLENDGCLALIRAHAVQPCKTLDFETRFKCRQTCGICQGAPVPIQLKGIRNLFELHNPNPEASFITPPPQDAIQFPGGDTFEYGAEYEIDVSEIYDDTPVTEGTVDATEKPMSKDENLYVPTVKPGPKSKTFEPQPTNNESANLLLSGFNVPIYFIILICVGFGLFLWIAAWIGWSCRKCCQAQKDKDEKYIRNEIFGEKHRQQTDPLPIPDSGVIYKQQAGAALARIGDVASSQENLVTKSVRDWPVEPSRQRSSTKPSEMTTTTTKESEKSRDRQKRTGYGHRRDRQQRESKRAPSKETEPETESGLGESDNDVNRLLNYHFSLQKEQQQQHKLDGGKTGSTHHDALMFLARDTTTLHRQQKLAVILEPPKRLTPEDRRINEINEMIRNANQEIQLDPDEIEDIEVVPLKGKTVSLGQPLNEKAPVQRKKIAKKPKATPLSKWADEVGGEGDNVKLDRNVHLASQMRKGNDKQAVIEIKELQKMKRYKSRKDREISDLAIKNQGRKIDAIKKRIDDIEAAAALSESDIHLSDLSD